MAMRRYVGRRADDVARCIEIGLTHGQTDDIAPRRLQFRGERGHRHRGRGFDPGKTIGKKGHGATTPENDRENTLISEGSLVNPIAA